MSINTLRRVVAIFCVGSIATMIVMSVKANVGGAMAGGAIGAIAILCLMTGNSIHIGDNGGGAQAALSNELAARVEELVKLGVDSGQAQSVITKAYRLGQGAKYSTNQTETANATTSQFS